MSSWVAFSPAEDVALSVLPALEGQQVPARDILGEGVTDPQVAAAQAGAQTLPDEIRQRVAQEIPSVGAPGP
jgi:hypothetical protein